MSVVVESRSKLCNSERVSGWPMSFMEGCVGPLLGYDHLV